MNIQSVALNKWIKLSMCVLEFQCQEFKDSNLDVLASFVKVGLNLKKNLQLFLYLPTITL